MRPTGEYIFLKEHKDYQSDIVTPDSIAGKQQQGTLFEILDTGPGYHTPEGKIIPLEVQTGDLVALVGMIQTIPYKADKILIARASDVVAYERDTVIPGIVMKDSCEKLQ